MSLCNGRSPRRRRKLHAIGFSTDEQQRIALKRSIEARGMTMADLEATQAAAEAVRDKPLLQRIAKAEAYDEYDHYIANAWRQG